MDDVWNLGYEGLVITSLFEIWNKLEMVQKLEIRNHNCSYSEVLDW